MKTSRTVVAAFLLLIVGTLAIRPEVVAQTPRPDTRKSDAKKLSEEEDVPAQIVVALITKITL